ncbi:MAG: hypothetical protein N2515_07490, partial [Deltaproteobacteria bacterium]|nr:hypothetical protein [Deltaproteobacteria bacterium]
LLPSFEPFSQKNGNRASPFLVFSESTTPLLKKPKAYVKVFRLLAQRLRPRRVFPPGPLGHSRFRTCQEPEPSQLICGRGSVGNRFAADSLNP